VDATTPWVELQPRVFVKNQWDSAGVAGADLFGAFFNSSSQLRSSFRSFSALRNSSFWMPRIISSAGASSYVASEYCRRVLSSSTDVESRSRCLISIARSASAIARKLDDDVLHLNRYAIAFLEPDPKAMSEQAAWFADKPEVENEMLGLQAETEAYSGHLCKARELSRRAADSAVRADNKEAVALWLLFGAFHEELFGEPDVHEQAAAAVATSQDHLLLKLPPSLEIAIKTGPAHLSQLTHSLDTQSGLQGHPCSYLVVDALSPESHFCRRRAPTLCKACLKKSTSTVLFANNLLSLLICLPQDELARRRMGRIGLFESIAPIVKAPPRNPKLPRQP
jgi:hypothetical protein